MKALSFGEILWDVYHDKKYLGGAPLNFAAHFSKQGGESYMLSALGKDELGKEALAKLSEWEIESEYISLLNDHPTGRCIVTLNSRSVPLYDLLQHVAYDHIPFRSVSENFDLLYFGTLALRSTENFAVLKKLIRENSFSEILTDVNIRKPFYSRESVQFSVENATVLKISQEELPTVAELLEIFDFINYKHFAQKTAKLYSNLKCIVITRGADGAYALECKSEKEYSAPAPKSNVVSTVGAGDSFSAAFIYWYLQQKDIRFCLDRAARLAAYVVSEYDAVPDYRIDRNGLILP